MIHICIFVCCYSDLAQDLVVLEEHFGYSYIELQLVSQLSFSCMIFTFCYHVAAAVRRTPMPFSDVVRMFWCHFEQEIL